MTEFKPKSENIETATDLELCTSLPRTPWAIWLMA